MNVLSVCLGACQGRAKADTNEVPRWVRDEKQAVAYSVYTDDDKRAEEAGKHIARSIINGDAKAVVEQETRNVSRKFAGDAQAAFNWRECFGKHVFETLFQALRLVDFGSPDHEHALPGFLANLSDRLRDMLDWVVATAPKVFEWSLDYMNEHKKEIAISLAWIAAAVIMWEMVPVVLAAIGFCEEGVLAGSIAARWMKVYLGRIPKGSWMSFWQRLGATWGRALPARSEWLQCVSNVL